MNTKRRRHYKYWHENVNIIICRQGLGHDNNLHMGHLPSIQIIQSPVALPHITQTQCSVFHINDQLTIFNDVGL